MDALTAPFLRIVELHRALKLAPMTRLPQPWREAIDTDWRIEVNGTGTEIEAIPPYSAVCFYQDLPVLHCDPSMGIQIGGQEDGRTAERAFLDAIEARIVALGGEVEVLESAIAGDGPAT